MPPLLRRAAREIHFVASMVLALLLVFFAMTGFMAEHREWFHERFDRSLLADPRPLTGPCGPDALIAAAATEGAIPEGTPRRGTDAWELAAMHPSGPVRLRCLEGQDTWFLGEVHAAEPLRVSATHFRDAVVFRFGGNREDGRVTGLDPAEGEIARASTVWQTTTVQLREDEGVAVAFTHHLPFANGLIDLHRGRGSTARLIDVTAILAIVVACSGVLHGLRYPGRRRRVLLALLAASALLTGALLAG